MRWVPKPSDYFVKNVSLLLYYFKLSTVDSIQHMLKIFSVDLGFFLVGLEYADKFHAASSVLWFR